MSSMRMLKKKQPSRCCCCFDSRVLSGLLLLLLAEPAVSWLLTTSTSTSSFKTSSSYRQRYSSSSKLAATNDSSNNNNKNNNIPSNVRLLILPGFGNDRTDYYLPDGPAAGSLVTSLQKRGWASHQITVLPVKRWDWLQVFLKGALDVQFWLASAPPTRPAFAWYLERIANSIEELTTTTTTTTTTDDDDDTVVVIIGHSAGGWLARAALGFGSSSNIDADTTEMVSTNSSNIDLNRVLGMVTLGAPHVPPPPDIMDMTRGALRITDEAFPGAYHSAAASGNGDDDSGDARDGGLFYITAIGNAVQGDKDAQPTQISDAVNINGKSDTYNEEQAAEVAAKLARFAYNSYEAVSGVGNAVGDGVVPVSAGHLEGALQLDLEGIYHSIGTPERWYGSDAVMDQWHDDMLREIQNGLSKKTSLLGTTTQQNMLTNPLENLFRR